ncbi:MAG TPA: metallophosphoesterase, partial [Candidatus Hydrogenedentes bacterium]|nr:metallophosphoesterase [Candidatus Hydrogenedentota bacterium]
MPDQVTLTWNDDPRTTQTVQWRTDTSVKDGVVRLREAGDQEWVSMPAAMDPVEDRLLMNDRYIHHYTAVLRNLKPGTTYTYRVGSPATDRWSDTAEFTTAPAGEAPFSFLYTGDAHNSESWGALLQAAFRRHPEMAFNIIGGDVVSTGLDRAQWDQVLEYGKDIYARKPLAFCLGNHDDQDGLGVGLILSMFRFPDNGPSGVERGRIFTFAYSNAQFFVVDVGTPIEVVTPWLERELANSTATWKFFVYHFPLYNDGEYDYSSIAEQWCPLFDTYHVDL